MDPLVMALQKIVESKRLLEDLVTSSESFDYRKAKVTLKSLEEMIRTLSKAQAELSVQSPLQPRTKMPSNIQPVDFRNRRAGSA
jgi:hypothetical protein